MWKLQSSVQEKRKEQTKTWDGFRNIGKRVLLSFNNLLQSPAQQNHIFDRLPCSFDLPTHLSTSSSSPAGLHCTVVVTYDDKGLSSQDNVTYCEVLQVYLSQRY
jgi:hypothetical protein